MKKIVLFVAALVVSACATMPYQPYAREVKKKPGEGGVIALKTEHRPEDRQRADSLMAANCGSDSIVKVQEEGEIVVGEKTHTNASKTQGEQEEGFSLAGFRFISGTKPSEDTSSTSETIKLKEWQIAYECVAIKQPASKSKKNISRK